MKVATHDYIRGHIEPSNRSNGWFRSYWAPAVPQTTSKDFVVLSMLTNNAGLVFMCSIWAVSYEWDISPLEAHYRLSATFLRVGRYGETS